MRATQHLTSTHRRWRYVIAGAIVGSLAGVIISSFRWLIGQSLHFITTLYHSLILNPWGLLWFIPLSLLIAYVLGLIVKSEPYIKGSGIPQVELQIQGHLNMNWWSILWKKYLAGSIAIGSGLLLGREGPSIQLGAAIGQGFAESIHSNRVQRNILISSGAGAGLAAAFNAPIAGLMFVLEEVHHTFSPLVALTTLTATICANFVSLHIFGNQPALNLNNYVLYPLKYYLYLAVLGLILAGFGWIYQQVTFKLPVIYQTIVPRVPPHFYGMIAVIAIIPVGLLRPDLLGGGGELILSLIEGHVVLSSLGFMLLIRFIYSMLSYGTGLPGGIFLPILSLGGLVGACYGQLLIQMGLVPEQYFMHFIFFAMAGGFAAIGKAPLTALLLVSEMVGGLNQLMPLGIVVLAAYLTAEYLHMPPIYEALAERLMHQSTTPKIGQRTTFEVPVYVESPLIGKKIREITWPSDVLIATIRRGEKELITKGDVILQPGDILIAVTDAGIVGNMTTALTQLVQGIHHN